MWPKHRFSLTIWMCVQAQAHSGTEHPHRRDGGRRTDEGGCDQGHRQGNTLGRSNLGALLALLALEQPLADSGFPARTVAVLALSYYQSHGTAARQIHTPTSCAALHCAALHCVGLDDNAPRPSPPPHSHVAISKLSDHSPPADARCVQSARCAKKCWRK